MSKPARITWVAVKGKGDVAMVVEEERQTEYARIVTLRAEPATPHEVDAWKFPYATEAEQ